MFIDSLTKIADKIDSISSIEFIIILVIIIITYFVNKIMDIVENNKVLRVNRDLISSFNIWIQKAMSLTSRVEGYITIVKESDCNRRKEYHRLKEDLSNLLKMYNKLKVKIK